MTLPHRSRFPWNLDWNLLRTFMVVVEQRGISKAAVFLGLKQPTISSALQRLEQAVGKTLVIRKPNEFTVTRAGQVLYAECATIFGAVSQLPTILNEDNTDLRGHLSVAITSSVVSEHFDDFLNRFSTAHPGVTYSFSVNESDEVERMVTQMNVPEIQENASDWATADEGMGGSLRGLGNLRGADWRRGSRARGLAVHTR